MRDDCHYCGCWTFPTGHKAFQNNACRADQKRTRDHVVAKVRGGKGLGNFVTACERCNSAKSADDYNSFKQFADVMLRGEVNRKNVREVRYAFKAWKLAPLFS